MGNSGIRRNIGIISLSACLLALALPVRAADPVCKDPKTGKIVPCTPTPESGGQPGAGETNGRLCLGAYADLNFNGAQDAGEPFLGGGLVKVIAPATGAVL